MICAPMDRRPQLVRLTGGLAFTAIACLVPAPPTPTPAIPAPLNPPAPADGRAHPISTLPAALGDPQHDPSQWFPFPPRDINSPPGVVDLSALDDAPAGARGFVRAKGGHFVDGVGNRIRLFGVNCTATACLPTHETAPRAAAHLARLGVNVVRLHLMDKASAPFGLLTADGKGLDPAQLERLDFFVAELAKRGVYVDLNLHVARNYEGLDGEAARRFDMGKLLDRFYPPFISSQKQYARALLTHVNPYTQHAYAAEPAVLCVEMNNENTAMPFWAGNLDDLPEPFGGELGRQWNKWLETRYRTTARLTAAWRGGANSAPVREVLENADLSEGTKGWAFESAGVPTRGEVVAIDTGGRALRFSADRRGSASWSLQFYRAHLPLREGQWYRVSFRVRAPEGVAGSSGAIPPARELEVTAMLGVPDWHNLGLERTLALAPAWQTVELAFRPQGTIEGEGRLNFSLRNVPGIVEIADLSVQAGSPPVKLAADQTVERGTIPLVRGENGTPAGEDFLRFLADTDRSTAREIARFVRGELGLKSMLVDTQVNYGGLEGVRREVAVSDFIDMHAYWQQPDWPFGWSVIRFEIPNTTQVAASDGGALGLLAPYRVAGKPFTVGEYNVPAPNDYAGEGLPMYAAIAGLQDWDAIYAYTYLDFSPEWDADHLLGFFSLAGDPAALAFLPVAAMAFRSGLVAPAHFVGRLALPPPGTEPHPLTGEGSLARLWAEGGTRPFDAAGAPRIASERMEIVTKGVAQRSDLRTSDCQKRHNPANCVDPPGETGEVTWLPKAEQPTLRMAAGAIAGRTIELGDTTITVGGLPRHDASIALVALDGRPLTLSKRILLVAVARVENTGMAFKADRTGLLSWGRAPALAEYVPLTVTVPWTQLHAERLDSAGQFAGEIPVASGADGRSVLHLDHQPSLWFLLQR
jgi:hypothetical protein